jgi:hypothetical protein
VTTDMPFDPQAGPPPRRTPFESAVAHENGAPPRRFEDSSAMPFLSHKEHAGFELRSFVEGIERGEFYISEFDQKLIERLRAVLSKELPF